MPTGIPTDAPTVLIVDDDGGVRTLVRRMLEAEGYLILEAADGEDALSLLAGSGPVDLVVTNVRMPRMDGRALASALAARAPHIPVLFMSGYDDQVGKSELPGPVLPKPFTPEALSAEVHRLLAQQTGD